MLPLWRRSASGRTRPGFANPPKLSLEALEAREVPAVTLAMADDQPASGGAAATTILLARAPGGTGIYRYDRAGLLAAIGRVGEQAA